MTRGRLGAVSHVELTSPGARRGVRETPGKCAHTDGVSRSPPNAVSGNDAFATPWRVLDRLKNKLHEVSPASAPHVQTQRALCRRPGNHRPLHRAAAPPTHTEAHALAHAVIRMHENPSQNVTRSDAAQSHTPAETPGHSEPFGAHSEPVR